MYSVFCCPTFRLTGLANTLTAAGRHRQAALVAGIAEQWID